jgi:MSHA pilin protein MshA
MNTPKRLSRRQPVEGINDLLLTLYNVCSNVKKQKIPYINDINEMSIDKISGTICRYGITMPLYFTYTQSCNMQNKQRGFTLIELIIVIVILGILAAVAAPRFINMGSDARIASLEGLEGSLRSAANLVNLKARLENKTDCATDPTIKLGTDTITLRCGYPCPHPNGIAKAVNTDPAFTWVGGNCSGVLGAVEVRLNTAPDPANCKIRYVSARATRVPGYTLTTTGC